MTKENHAVSAREDRRKALPLAHLQLLLAILAISLGSRALAQTPPAGTDDPSQPFFYPSPPAGFDPVGAADADLATYGFPKRPPQGAASYTTWVNRIRNAKYRVANPVAQNTGIRHSLPPRAALPAGAVGGTEASYSWSGVDEVYPYAFFASNGSVVEAGTQMPSIGYENCSYGPYLTYIWAGMDGNLDAIAGNNDVLQGGFAAGACPTQNYAWYEWYTIGCTVDTPGQPCNAYSVNLPVNPGDYLDVTITYNTSSPHGTAFLNNQTTGQYISIGYNQPPGSSGSAYAGYSAEWIVERPSMNLHSFSPVNLANYYLPETPNNYLFLYPDYLIFPDYEPPGSDTSGTFNIYNMVCTSSYWNPSSACPGEPYISLAYYWYLNPPPGYGSGTLYFFVSGPAASQ
jgi:hypothetical protein